MKRIIKLSVVAVSLVLFLALVGYFFWEFELKYSLPTPLPKNYQPVAIGSRSEANSLVAKSNKPVLLHFFNKDCPCSRFHIKSFKSLVKNYRDSVDIYAVLQAKEEEISDDFKDYQLEIPVFLDAEGTIAKAYGVYSTPQVVVLDKNGAIYYRGNYNITRYCNNRETSFADIALESILAGKELPLLPEAALIPYGCELPSNEGQSSFKKLINLML